jgi:hypothetical protein
LNNAAIDPTNEGESNRYGRSHSDVLAHADSGPEIDRKEWHEMYEGATAEDEPEKQGDTGDHHSPQQKFDAKSENMSAHSLSRITEGKIDHHVCSVYMTIFQFYVV